ncbi:MAG: response regulator, partial [Acetobacteraceae bacterium]|nr:response regulator [Acetobacteraceae bacterium]
LLLWTIFGNGFRFGIRALVVATGIGLSCFVAVVLSTPFWRGHLALSVGLAAGMLMLPFYAGVLIGKLSNARARAEEARRAAEKASAAKSMFLASVSHELRTPLNAIIGYGALMLETRLSNAQAEAARTIDTQAKQLLSMIDNVLDFSRIEAGQMPVNLVQFRLTELIAHTRRLFAAQARAKGLRLDVHIEPGIPLTLRGDRRHLGEILFNLVGNAVKFTARGNVLISVRQGEPRPSGTSLRFEVSDTGIGIAGDAQTHIFEAFTQADSTIIGRFGGTGLGLALCRRLVTLLGGEIGLASVLDQGTTFFFDVPMDVPISAAPGLDTPQALPKGIAVLLAVKDRDEEARLRRLGERIGVAALRPGDAGRRGSAFVIEISDAHVSGVSAKLPRIAVLPEGETPDASLRHRCETWIRADAGTEDFAAAIRTVCELSEEPFGAAAKRSIAAMAADHPLHILVAEDNRTNQMVIRKILERAGHSCAVVSDGEAALTALASDSFGLVLMDVNMPGMNGIEATKLIRVAALGQAHLPILGLTADATAETALACEEAGMDACVTKPVEPARLLKVVAEYGVRRDQPMADMSAAPADPPPRRTPPNLRLVAAVNLDPEAARELEALGGPEFVTSVYAEFVTELDKLLEKLAGALAEGDFTQWRAQVHAIRSAAVNVGAKRLTDICAPLEGGSHLNFSVDGPEQLARLRDAATDLKREIANRTKPRRAAI